MTCLPQQTPKVICPSAEARLEESTKSIRMEEQHPSVYIATITLLSNIHVGQAKT